MDFTDWLNSWVERVRQEYIDLKEGINTPEEYIKEKQELLGQLLQQYDSSMRVPSIRQLKILVKNKIVKQDFKQKLKNLNQLILLLQKVHSNHKQNLLVIK